MFRKLHSGKRNCFIVTGNNKSQGEKLCLLPSKNFRNRRSLYYFHRKLNDKYFSSLILQIRNNAELLPIARDNNIDPDYKEFKHLPSMVRAYPGDRFITECTYDSSQRKVMTLGGQTSREERCMSHIYYYPRQRKLTTCNSSPSLPTVLHSMGIQELAL